MKVALINKSNYPAPAYATAHAAGLDLRANIEESIELKSLERVLVPTGLFMELPVGVEAQIRPRSGLAFKHGITVLNTPGTIDADYRGEIKVALINHGDACYRLNVGDRIAQLVIAPVVNAKFTEVVELSNESQRGTGGFGSTGS